MTHAQDANSRNYSGLTDRPVSAAGQKAHIDWQGLPGAAEVEVR